MGSVRVGASGQDDLAKDEEEVVAMLGFMAVAAVVPLAVLMWAVLMIVARLFPRTPPLVTVFTGLAILAATPIVYVLFGAVGRQVAREADLSVSTVEGFLLTMSAAVIVVLIYLLITMPAAQRRDGQAAARVGLWHAAAYERPELRIAFVRSYAMTRRLYGWADVQIGPHLHRTWLSGRCRPGELVLLECAPHGPAARVIDRLNARESARYQRRARRSVAAA